MPLVLRGQWLLVDMAYNSALVVTTAYWGWIFFIVDDCEWLSFSFCTPASQYLHTHARLHAHTHTDTHTHTQMNKSLKFLTATFTHVNSSHQPTENRMTKKGLNSRQCTE